MKNECDIVQDLLFGYVDNTLKKNSKELVEEHLKTCIKCESVLQEIRNEESKEKDIEEINGLKKINKKMKFRKRLLYIVSFLLVIFAILNIIVFIYYYSEAGTLEIFIKDNVNKEQEEKIKQIIYSIDEDASITYKSKEETLQTMRESVANELLEDYDEHNNIFPASYTVKTDVNKVDKIEEELLTLDEIKHITKINNKGPYLLFLEYCKINLDIKGFFNK